MFERIRSKLRPQPGDGDHPYLIDELPQIERPISQLCTQAQFNSPIYNFWCRRFREEPKRHRKQWEFVYILQALSRKGMLTPGRSGIGFGVGREPLPAVMASYGVKVCATDLGKEEAKGTGWVATNQHSSSLAHLNDRGICDQDAFEQLVTFAPINMNHLPDDLSEFDFTWSSCSLEHLGSLDNGLRFIEASLNILSPGSIAVHTTEFNCSSNDDTVSSGDTVIYRRRDILSFLDHLTQLDYKVSLTLADAGDPLDKFVDVPPYSRNNHVRLQIAQYVCTSIGLIIEKRSDEPRLCT